MKDVFIKDSKEVVNKDYKIVGIPKVYWCGIEGECNMMVMDLLGPSLQNLFSYCGKAFSLKTLLMIYFQTVRIPFIYSWKESSTFTQKIIFIETSNLTISLLD